MSDELQRQALARSLAVRLQLLGHRDVQLVDEVVIRLCQRASESPRSRVAREAIDDLIAGVEASLAEQDAEREHGREAARVEMLGERTPRIDMIAGVDGKLLPPIRGPALTGSSGPGGPGIRVGRAELMEAGTLTVFDLQTAAEFAPDQHLTRVSPDSAVIALGDERVRDEELEVEVELDSDPGPHTHVYQGTDRGDECMECGRMRDQFADLADEWGRGDVGGGA